MAIYLWTGKDRSGKKQKGEIEADNLPLARQMVIRKGIALKSVKKKPKALEDYFPALAARIKDKDKVIFVRQFATMIDAGLPLVQCLEILRDQQENANFKRVIRQIKKSVEEGATLSDAIKNHPRVFDNLFYNLVAAGEVGGILDVILNRLALYIEKMAKVKKRVKGALTYPAIVVSIAVIVITVIMIFVIPVFAGLFNNAGVKLPEMTLIVMNISNFTKHYIHWMVLGVVIVVMVLRRFYRTPRGRYIFDRIFLRAPIFGILLRKIAVARFTRTLGTMLSSGVPILDGLEVVAATAGNSVVEKAIRNARMSISEGRPVAEPLAETHVFPPMVTQMIAVGEATGALDNMLGKIADFYDEEVDTAVGNLTAMLEPLLILFLGVSIGFLLVAMYLPIFQLAGVVAR